MRCGKPLGNETGEYCADCTDHSFYYRQGRSVWVHREPVSSAVYRLKYKNRRSYAPVFAEEMYACFADEIARWKIDEIIPIPLHPSRKRSRGFNQAELLAAEISERTGIPMRNDVLFRIKKTKPQKKLDGKERGRNMSGAFAVSGAWNPCRNVLLIDDIYTTGSTIDRAAKILRIAGAENVYFLTISIGQGI